MEENYVSSLRGAMKEILIFGALIGENYPQMITGEKCILDIRNKHQCFESKCCHDGHPLFFLNV